MNKRISSQFQIRDRMKKGAPAARSNRSLLGKQTKDSSSQGPWGMKMWQKCPQNLFK